MDRIMATDGIYLAVFTMNKAGPRWQAWLAKTDAERKAIDAVGLPALEAWDDEHRDAIVHLGGPLGKTKRISSDGIADAVNDIAAFVVVRAPSHEAAARMFEGHPHFSIFPCDGADVMPLLGGTGA
jgi:hypothetical protein